MKKLLVSIFAATMIYGCANDRPQYDTQQFSNVNYQRNVVNAIEYADNFVDFDQDNIPKANLDAQDFSILLQADIAFNQGSYAKAGDSYYLLAKKYKDPRIIYKGIVCFEHSSASPVQFAKLNELINELISVDPNSKVSKLFGVRVALEKNDLATAKSDLHTVVKSDPTKVRAILVFLSTIISNDISKTSSQTLEEFAKYVQDKYGQYPESLLFGIVSFSVTANHDELFASLDNINQLYPNWEVPIYWAAGVLAKHEELKLMQAMLDHEIKTRKEPSSSLQNLYIASLISSDKLPEANGYIESELAKSPQNGNLMVNDAIVEYKLGNNQSAIKSLINAKQNDTSLNGAVDLAIGNLYDYSNHYESAVTYFQNVLAVNPLLSPAANMGIFRAYVNNNQIDNANKFADSLAAAAKLSAYDAAVLKISLFVGMGKYDIAYQYADQKIKLYSYDKTFVYLYASLSGLTNRTNQAITWYKKYIKLNPNDPIGYNDLGFIYADKTTEFLHARQLAEQAYHMSPNDPAIMDTLGWAYYKLGMYDKAVYYLLPAYRLTQDRDTALHLKATYIAQGQKDKADKVIITPQNIEKMQFEQNMLSQAMLILMYYQYGLDLSR